MALRQKFKAIVVLLALLSLLGRTDIAYGATPIHVCGIVTDYFVSDIPLGGLIKIDGKNYRIRSSASYQRTQPLPDVKVGSDVCLDGTVDDAGQLLDFTVTPRSRASELPGTATVRTAPPQSSAAAWPFALAAGALLGGAALVFVLGRRPRG